MEADDYNESGREALDAEDYAAAERHFREAIRLDPDWSTPHYNLGLTLKFQRRWPESLLANWRAHQLNPEDDAAFWNLAIASVATGDWDKARVAFKAIGLAPPEGAGPWDLRLGLIPIRICPEEAPEVVWCHRLDPVRAKIANVPLPESGRRFGDVVLNDGEPRGYKQYQGREVPIFNELELLERSEYATLQLEIEMDSEETVDNLRAVLMEHDIFAEDWSGSIRMICRACSEGRPHQHHDQELETEWASRRRLGVATRDQARLREVLGNRQILTLERLL